MMQYYMVVKLFFSFLSLNFYSFGVEGVDSAHSSDINGEKKKEVETVNHSGKYDNATLVSA